MRPKLTLLTALLGVVLITSCSTSKLAQSSKQDKDLFGAIQAIEKSNNAEATKDLPSLYQEAVQRHENKIAEYKNSTDPERWQNIIAELEALQKIYAAINASPASAKLVTPQNYSGAITDARKNGAEEYYDMGIEFLQSDSRDDARKAYKAFQAVNRIYPNYKDATSLLKKAEEKGILHIVINPVESRGYMYGRMSFTADNFQRNLVRDLGGDFGNNYSGAKFYTDWDARSKKVQPDWVVDLVWSNMYISPINSNSTSRNVSKQIETGKDANGKPIYQTVTATLYVTRKNIDARGEMEYRIQDVQERENIEWNRIPAYLNYNVEYATYTGDSRALSGYDLTLVNNSRFAYVDESAIVDELYERVYSQLRSRLETASRW